MDYTKPISQRGWMCVALAVLTAGAFWRVTECGFINFDDPAYVLENPQVRNGFTWLGLVWAFTQSHSANWHPLTWLSHMLDCQLFGLNPAAHHLTNLAFHIANTCLLFLLWHRLTGGLWRSAILAAFFAVHPLHVESVAWISERKDVLSTFFGLLALGAYARFAQSPPAQAGRPWTSHHFRAGLLFFALSLMSKPMLVTLPFLLLLLDWWPLQRIRDFGFRISDLQTFISRHAPLLREKLPFFALSLAACLIALWAQRRGGSVMTFAELSVADRLANALISYLRYVGKTFWPVNLSPLYPLTSAWPVWQPVVAGAALLGVTFLLWRLTARKPYLLLGWLWFIGVLAPVIGLVQVGGQAMADRYTYVPLIGLFLLMVWGVSDELTRWRRGPLAGGVVAALLLALCAGFTTRQVGYWQNDIAFFSRAATVTTNNALAQHNLAEALARVGRLSEARQHYEAAVRISPEHPLFHHSLGVFLARAGDTNAARIPLETAMNIYLEDIRKHPTAAFAYNSIGTALSALGEFQEATNFYAAAVQHAPDDHIFRNNLAVALARAGDLSGAIGQHQEAIRRRPDYADAHNNLGAELVSAGRVADALPHFEQALKLNPHQAEAHSNLGGALAMLGRDEEAVAAYRDALRLAPKLERVHFNLGLSLVRLGRLDEAANHFTVATELRPDLVEAHHHLGRCRFLQGRPDAAVPPLTEAVKLSPDHAAARLYLGRAWAAVRRPDLAIPQLREALRLRPESIETRVTLAWMLATETDVRYRSGEEAIQLVEAAAAIEAGRQPLVLDVLAAAYAEAGRFAEATATAQRAAAAARSRGQTNLAGEIEQRLEMYRAGRPFRGGDAPR